MKEELLLSSENRIFMSSKNVEIEASFARSNNSNRVRWPTR